MLEVLDAAVVLMLNFFLQIMLDVYDNLLLVANVSVC
jgi:hypothetical protein